MFPVSRLQLNNHCSNSRSLVRGEDIEVIVTESDRHKSSSFPRTFNKYTITVMHCLITTKMNPISKISLCPYISKAMYKLKTQPVRAVASVEHPQRISAEPDWVRAHVPGKLYPHDEPAIGSDNKRLPIMQTDILKPFYLDIAKLGLNYAYQKLKLADLKPELIPEEVEKEVEKFKFTKTKKPKTVVIIGAGMSGLVAAYELAQAGHNVQILEAQHRVGGRVRTFADQHFYPGLWSDGKHNKF